MTDARSVACCRGTAPRAADRRTAPGARDGRYASRVALIRSANERLIPGTAAICSTGASRTRLIYPKTFRSSRLRFGPTPGRSSNADLTVRRSRSVR
jgi:hypothetical protein